MSEVDVTFLTRFDKITFPVGMYYMPKSMSGDECYTQFKDMIKDVQVCANCVATSHSTENILGGYHCSAYGADCVNQQMLCNNCQLLGHTSHMPQLQLCHKCATDNIPCNKLAVIFLSSDCEGNSKKALE